jgi:mevalonate kinase
MTKNDINTPIFSSKGNGKLMISGEYMVLKGAKALSVPLQLGQDMNIYTSLNNELTWNAYHPGGLWSKVCFNNKLTITEASDISFAKMLQKILRIALKASKLSIKDIMYKNVITKLDFMPQWGLGSSSTLIYNLSRWFKIDPYELLSKTFNGSGYDIANAQSAMPIFFLLIHNKPRSVEINFAPSFSDKIFFVYSGHKQSSKKSIRNFHTIDIASHDLTQISSISTRMAVCNHLIEFQELMTEHETIIAHTLNKKPIQQAYFSDFKGSIKSLGAWGGDFIMAVSDQPDNYIQQYFKEKKLDTLFKYKDLVLKNTCAK